MTPLQKGRLVIDGDRTAGTRDRGIGGSWFLGIFRTGPLGFLLTVSLRYSKVIHGEYIYTIKFRFIPGARKLKKVEYNFYVKIQTL